MSYVFQLVLGGVGLQRRRAGSAAKGNVEDKRVMDTIRKANARHAKVKLNRRRSSNTHPRFELQEKEQVRSDGERR
jgi:hypothetical protein